MEPKVFSGGKTRQGRGFSYLELKNANMDVRMAKDLGLRIDKRRRTAHEENIRFLGKKAAGEKKRLEKEAQKKAKKAKAGKGKKKGVESKKPSKPAKKAKPTGTAKKKATPKSKKPVKKAATGEKKGKAEK